MFNIKSSNPNYLARIVRINSFQPHPNANKLKIAIIDNNQVITSIDAKENDIYVYFPLESCLNFQYLSWSNSFSSSDLNADKSKKGFFANSGRIKAIKLRGSKSEGYIIPLTDLQQWLLTCNGKHFEITEDLINKDFDSFDDILICEKYVNKQELAKLRQPNKHDKKRVRVSRIIDDQFRLSQDITQLGKYINNIRPEDIISITSKIHGANFSCGRILCKKPLKRHERFLKFFGANIIDYHYDLVYSSRRIIKNAYADKQHNSFYSSDIWGIVADKLKGCLLDGVTLYGEVCGYTPTGSFIQKGYDYNCDIGQLDFYIFRITYTNFTGKVFEFSWQQIKNYCDKYSIKYVPELYYGYAKDLFGLEVNDDWHTNFLKALSDKYLEKDCKICRAKTPDEGIVLRSESGDYTPYKYKSFAFKQLESKQLDEGNVDIETQESVVV